MKPDPQRRQADLFEGEPQPLAILPTQQEELIKLLSQLLWQVSSAHAAVPQETSDEQDRT